MSSAQTLRRQIRTRARRRRMKTVDDSDDYGDDDDDDYNNNSGYLRCSLDLVGTQTLI